ncbi:ABC transporter ATP-binding protein [Candidatus Dojkabacteria bacterium]|nr:ABC transporter ATP-binding protein [Candidatus Dojkabacteria bacterium]
MKNIIELESVSKKYPHVKALNSITYRLPVGESLAVIGPSGSGKSTFLNLLGGLDKPTGGKIIVAGKEISKLSDKELSEFRNKTIGFIFQFFNLHDFFTAKENVAFPLLISGRPRLESLKEAEKLLVRMGLQDRLNYKPKFMSGGEMQRVAIARALANNPSLILADEPTGNLDRGNAEKVVEIFDMIAKSGVSVVTITHDESISRQFKNTLRLDKGAIK